MKEKLLIISRNFPPLTGGMEKLIWNCYDQLKQKYDITLVGPTDCSRFVDSKDNSIECDENSIIKFLLQAFITAKTLIKNNKYSLIISGSGVTAPVSVLLSMSSGIPSITYTHGLDLITNNIVYQLLFMPFIRRSTSIIVNSHNTSMLAQQKIIASKKIKLLFPGVTIPSSVNTNHDIRKQYGLENKKILLIAGRLTKRKGIKEFINHSFTKIIKKYPHTVLIIAGSEPKKSIKSSGNVLRDIEDVIIQRSLHNNIIVTGHVDNDVLASLYTQSDLFVFPVIDMPGDVEGFGMVTLEAAAHGLATVAFDTGGISDAVDIKRSGQLVETGNYQKLTEAIMKYIDTPGILPVSKESCVEFAKEFDWNIFGDKLSSICAEVIQNHKNHDF